MKPILNYTFVCRPILIFLATTFCCLATGQISILSLPYNPPVTDFNAYNPNSASNLALTIPAGWTAASSGTQVYNGQGNGILGTGGYWAYGVTGSGEFSLGALRSGTPGNITYTVSFVNNSGSTINSITLGWDYEQWRYMNTSGWNVSGTGALAGNATLNALDFTGLATGTPGIVTVSPVAVTLSGLSIANGASFGISWITTDVTGADNGIAIDNFSIAACATPTLALGTNPTVCPGTTSASISYNLSGSADQYSIDYSAAANSAGFVDVLNATIPPNAFPVTIPAAAPIGNYTATVTVRNSIGGCVSANHTISINIIDCAAPYMNWVPLPDNEVHASCTSATDCDNNTVCYGLQYIPNSTGTLTSYTTTFFIDCSTLGNPVVSNISCVMDDTNSEVNDGCVELDSVQIVSSGNDPIGPQVTIMQNVPIILHQVCIMIPNGESLQIVEDTVADLTTSINLSGGGAISEFPAYTPFSISSDLECVTLPVRWLHFQVKPAGEMTAQLDWITSEEINNSHFEIQRSNDGGRTFQKIGIVNAGSRDETIHKYQFMDPGALPGKNYYRLKQIDFDSRYSFSPLRSLIFASESFIAKAWPNPASDRLNISIINADQAGTIRLVDFSGKQLLTRKFEGGMLAQELIMEDLQPGLYMLIVLSGDNRHVEKIVVVE